jgi:hypothetical protein
VLCQARCSLKCCLRPLSKLQSRSDRAQSFSSAKTIEIYGKKHRNLWQKRGCEAGKNLIELKRKVCWGQRGLPPPQSHNKKVEFDFWCITSDRWFVRPPQWKKSLDLHYFSWQKGGGFREDIYNCNSVQSQTCSIGNSFLLRPTSLIFTCLQAKWKVTSSGRTIELAFLSFGFMVGFSQRKIYDWWAHIETEASNQSLML